MVDSANRGMAMPDSTGLLTSAERQKAIEHLKRFGADDTVCPICRSNRWILGDHVVQPMINTGATLRIGGGPAYPQIMLISNPCGYTIYFNAILAGVLTSETLGAALKEAKP